MSRTLKLVVFAAIIEMTLVAVAVIALRHDSIPWIIAPFPKTPLVRPPLFLLVFVPASFVLLLVIVRRRLHSNRLRLSETHRHYVERSLQVGAAFFVAIQGLGAYVDYTGAVIDQELIMRGVCAFLGLWLVIQGNAAAKLDPPGGERAPAASVWTRTLLRLGWLMVALGLGLVVCALTLRGSLLEPAMITAGVISLVGEVAYRRMLRPARTA